MDQPHEHRPGPAEQRATLAVYRAVLRGDGPEAVREAAGHVCLECALGVAAAFGISFAEEYAIGLARRFGAELDLTVVRAALLELIGQAERDLGSGLN
jgi:hypothetical protein